MAERQPQGTEPWSMDPWTMDPWTRTMSSGFRFWLSLWPVAPLFGVEWRFADMAGKVDPEVGDAAKATTEQAAAIGNAPVVAAVEAATEMAGAMTAAAEQAIEVTESAAASAHEAVEEAEASASKAVEEAEASAKKVARKAAKMAPAADRVDDLTQIKGIGPGLARQLDELGIRNFAQIAAMSEKELAEVDEKLTSMKGRCFRDDWIGQAKGLKG